MIHLSLTPTEAIELLNVLIAAGDKRLAARLSTELVNVLESLDKLGRDRHAAMASAWIKSQHQKMNKVEEEDVG